MNKFNKLLALYDKVELAISGGLPSEGMEHKVGAKPPAKGHVPYVIARPLEKEHRFYRPEPVLLRTRVPVYRKGERERPSFWIVFYGVGLNGFRQVEGSGHKECVAALRRRNLSSLEWIAMPRWAEEGS